MTDPNKRTSRITGIRCEGYKCRSKNATKYRQRTFYVDESDNWVTLCPKCRKENDAYWNERWDEYYADCMWPK